MYHGEVKVVSMPVSDWLREYYRPEVFLDACKGCPNYGTRWSCPPLPQDTPSMVRPFSRIHLVGIKVVYDPQTRAAAATAAQADHIRRETYGRVKRALLEVLLEMESAIPGSWCIAAGECELCPVCSRAKGTPCVMPERMRYSFSGLGLDLTRIANEVLQMPLLWQKDGLPEYNVAIGALLDRQDSVFSQSFQMGCDRPWQLLREQIVGVLNQIGCKVVHEPHDAAGVSLVDQATGDRYRLSFPGNNGTSHRMVLENQTGSGRRMPQLAQCLRSRFPELQTEHEP